MGFRGLSSADHLCFATGVFLVNNLRKLREP